jgi:type I restriction enzyme, S subunit
MGVSLGFKRSDAGVVPIDWTVSRLGELGKCSSGTTPLRVLYERYFRNGSTPWVKTLDLTNGLIISTSENVTDVALKETSLKVYPVGTVLVAMYGGFQQIGRTGLLRIPAAVNQALTAIQVDDSRLASEFLLATLNYRIEYWKMVASSSRKDPNITGSDIRRFPIAYPSYARQRAVATALGDVDALLDGLDRLIAKKRDLKQAAMQQLLTGQTRLPGFSGEWEVKRLGDIADTDPENIGSEAQPDYTFKYISLEEVDCGFLRGYSEQRLVTAPSRAQRKLRLHDVLVSTVRPNLQSHLLFREKGSDWVCSTGFCVLRCRENLAHSGFIFFHLFGYQVNHQIEALLTGSNYPAINSGDVRDLQISLPDIPEQKAITAILTDMDAELTALEARHNKTRALKQAMMQELLTGRIRLVGPEPKAELHV